MRRGLFSFREDPFRNHPDPRFFYPSPAYGHSYSRLVTRASTHPGLILLLGCSGVGKTTMLLKLRQDLEAAGVCAIYPEVKQATLSSVLEQCCRCVGLELGDAAAGEPERLFSEYLQSQRADGKAIAVLIDDAHLLQPASLIGVWDLVHAGTDARSVPSVVLAGHGNLEERFRSSELAKMKKALIERIKLKPLDPQQVGHFIRHRLWIVGYTGPDLFTDEAIERIAEYSKGRPSVPMPWSRNTATIPPASGSPGDGTGVGAGVTLDAGPVLMEVQAASLGGFLEQGKGLGAMYRLMFRF